jgi:hypothetical protein
MITHPVPQIKKTMVIKRDVLLIAFKNYHDTRRKSQKCISVYFNSTRIPENHLDDTVPHAVCARALKRTAERRNSHLRIMHHMDASNKGPTPSSLPVF